MCYRSRLVFNYSFEDTDISQGSVATHLRYGGIFTDCIITNVLLILTEKKIENRLRTKQSVPVLWATLYCCRPVSQEQYSAFKLELCADELVVGGGVGWSYDRRRRRAAHFSSAAAAWLYGRRRRRQRRQTG